MDPDDLRCIDFRGFILIFMDNKYCMYKFKVQKSRDGKIFFNI